MFKFWPLLFSSQPTLVVSFVLTLPNYLLKQHNQHYIACLTNMSDKTKSQKYPYGMELELICYMNSWVTNNTFWKQNNLDKQNKL